MSQGIDISHFEVEAATVSGTPELGFVSVSDLLIDDRYQRSIESRGKKNIKRIAEHFDWAKFSPVLLSRRSDGKFAIIDGQHRAHAAAICGIEKVPAMISELTIEEEAAAFSWVNATVTQLTPNQLFRGALAALEPWAVQCDAVVRSAGCKLMTFNKSSKGKRPGEVFCIGLVRKFVEAGNSVHVSCVLKGISQSNIREQSRYYNAFGLAVLVPCTIRCSVTNPEVVTNFLDAHDLDRIRILTDKVRERPENQNRSFKALYEDSLAVLMKQFLTDKIRSLETVEKEQVE